MDKTDVKILNALKENSKQSVRDISKSIKIPPTTIHSRINKLKKEGIIKRFTIEIDNEKIGLKTSAYILVALDSRYFQKTKQPESYASEELMKNSSVEEAANVTGSRDLVAKVRVRDMKDMDKFIMSLRGKEMILRTETMMILHEGKDEKKGLDEGIVQDKD